MDSETEERSAVPKPDGRAGEMAAGGGREGGRLPSATRNLGHFAGPPLMRRKVQLVTITEGFVSPVTG